MEAFNQCQQALIHQHEGSCRCVCRWFSCGTVHTRQHYVLPVQNHRRIVVVAVPDCLFSSLPPLFLLFLFAFSCRCSPQPLLYTCTERLEAENSSSQRWKIPVGMWLREGSRPAGSLLTFATCLFRWNNTLHRQLLGGIRPHEDTCSSDLNQPCPSSSLNFRKSRQTNQLLRSSQLAQTSEGLWCGENFPLLQTFHCFLPLLCYALFCLTAIHVSEFAGRQLFKWDACILLLSWRGA